MPFFPQTEHLATSNSHRNSISKLKNKGDNAELHLVAGEDGTYEYSSRSTHLAPAPHFRSDRMARLLILSSVLPPHFFLSYSLEKGDDVTRLRYIMMTTSACCTQQKWNKENVWSPQCSTLLAHKVCQRLVLGLVSNVHTIGWWVAVLFLSCTYVISLCETFAFLSILFLL